MSKPEIVEMLVEPGDEAGVADPRRALRHAIHPGAERQAVDRSAAAMTNDGP